MGSHYAKLSLLREGVADLGPSREEPSTAFFHSQAASDPPFHHTANVPAEQKASIKGADLLAPSKIPQPLLSLELGGY